MRDYSAVRWGHIGRPQHATDLQRLAVEAAWQVKKALLARGIVPELILHAAAEQFVDSLIRHGRHAEEFRELARAYRDSIWPTEFTGIKVRSVRAARLKGALRAAQTAIATIEGVANV